MMMRLQDQNREYILKLNGYQISNLSEMLIKIANDPNDRQKYDNGDWFAEIAHKIRQEILFNS